jgi:hypothetical protein
MRGKAPRMGAAGSVGGLKGRLRMGLTRRRARAGELTMNAYLRVSVFFIAQIGEWYTGKSPAGLETEEPRPDGSALRHEAEVSAKVAWSKSLMGRNGCLS